MTELPAPPTTESTAQKTEARQHYEKLKSEGTRLRLSALLQGSKLELCMPLGDVRGAKRKYPFRCECGTEFKARPTDMFRHKSYACKHCTFSERMKAELATEEGAQHQRKMTANAAKSNRKPKEWKRLYAMCNGAKARCANPNNKYYGGRGIRFLFASPSDMAHWVHNNLGYPEPGQSIDRVDNNGHYEPGNLRWADRNTQGQNKRAYSNGARTRRLQKLRPDYHINSIRAFVREGLTDDEITQKQKGKHCRSRLRHHQLRPEK